MGTISSQKGKGSYAAYRSANKAGQHKEVRMARIARKLARRKEWRIAKYGQTPQVELSGTTITLFKNWGVPLVGPKKTKKPKEVLAPEDTEMQKSIKDHAKRRNK